jgi:hypothetical protein
VRARRRIGDIFHHKRLRHFAKNGSAHETFSGCGNGVARESMGSRKPEKELNCRSWS